MQPRHWRRLPRPLLILLFLWSTLLGQRLPVAAHPHRQTATTNTSGWFPFTPQGADTAKTLTSAADLLLDSPTDNPATLIDQRGFVKTDANGHFVFTNTGKRVRFWGTNLGAQAAFPPSPTYPPQSGEAALGAAAQLAARLAKLGFNAVRLHHLDNPDWAADGSGTLWQAAWDNTLVINPAQLDRLDHLIYQLKRQAIYVDLNLHVSRTFRRGDGVTAADELAESDIEFSKNVTIFDPVAIALQKRFAEQLLTHVNPYTGLAYKDDPVIFTTETTNEDALFMGLVYDQLNWRPGDPTSLPSFYSQELDGWSSRGGGPQINRLHNPAFEGDQQGWAIFNQEGAAATVTVVNSGVNNTKALSIQIDQRGPNGWDLQLAQTNLALLGGQVYELSFAVRATQPATINGAVMRHAAPWESFGWSAAVNVTTAWTTYATTFTANQTNFGQTRLSFDLGNLPVGSTIFFDNVVLREKAAMRGWHGWLEDKYGSTTAIRNAWAPTNPTPETEMLRNPSFENGLTGWDQATFAGAQATFTVDAATATDGTNSVQIKVTQPGSEAWHVQLGQGNFAVTQGQVYRIAFDAKADSAGAMSFGLIQNHDPYGGLGFYGTAALTTQWQSFEGIFRAETGDTNARLNLDLSQRVRTIWIDNVTVKPYNPNGLLASESLEANNIARLPRQQWGGFTPQRMRDTVQFYAEIEAAYFAAMRDYQRSTLGARALNGGTANYFNNLAHLPGQAALDFVDNHYYWDHPSWPAAAPWSPTGWVIKNNALVNGRDQTGSALFDDLFDKAVLAVKGKPFTLTEFNAVAPNRYEVEGPLLLATFANLQDWDAIFHYTYAEKPTTYTATALQPAGFFDVVGNPIDSSVLPIAARLFLRSQTSAAPTETALRFTRNETLESMALGYGGAASYFLQTNKGIQPAAAFGSRLRSSDFNAATPVTIQAPTPSGPRYVSGGGQLTWDVTTSGKARYLINAPQFQGVVGFVNGQTITLPNLTITVSGAPTGAPANAEFAALTLQSLSADTIQKAGQLLLGALTRFENTGMLWNNSFTSVDERWGSAPALVEPIRFDVTLTVAGADRAVVRILDETGAVRGVVTHQVLNSSQIRFTIDTGRDKTLWYAIEKETAATTGSIAGVLTAGSTPLSGVRATAYANKSGKWRAVAKANSDSTGRYTIAQLAPGVYRVGFSKIGYTTIYYNNVTAIRNATDVTVAAGVTTDNINGALPVARPKQGSSIIDGPRLLANLIDARNSASIPAAIATLYHVPGWQPRQANVAATADSCQSNQALEPNIGWSQPAPVTLGEWVEPTVDEDIAAALVVTPTVNPQLSTVDGHLGWGLSTGCWYLQVEAAGYESTVSPVIGINNDVVTLALALTPTASALYNLYLPLSIR